MQTQQKWILPIRSGKKFGDDVCYAYTLFEIIQDLYVKRSKKQLIYYFGLDEVMVKLNKVYFYKIHKSIIKYVQMLQLLK